ncbi:MAG: hypothetical protein IT432_14080 [Phycisphaerales bacterium]|nr:hypothetical protein [Phycisphaerales bacterium]
MSHTQNVLAACLLVAITSVSASAQPAKPDHAAQPPAKSEPPQRDDKKAEAPLATRAGEAYPLSTCPISGGKLGSMGDPIVKIYDGREVRFCCKSCPPKFENDLAQNIATLDKAIINDQAPLYPLKTSVVSGKALPEKPVEFVYGNRLVRVASADEKTAFMIKPDTFIAELDKAAIDAQAKDYPLKKCAVSGEELGSMGKPIDVVVGGRLIRLCCKSCKKDVLNDPAKFIAVLDSERKNR